MVDFRKALLLLAVLVFATGIASAQFAPLQCVAQSGNVPPVRAEGVAEEVGQIVINCTGGNPTLAGDNIPTVNVQIGLNVNVTSNVLGSGGLEALLLIDEPNSNNQSVCPYGTVCTVTSLGGGVYGGGPAGRPNVFVGAPTGTNGVVWNGIPLDPPGTTTPGANRVLRMVNVRANANQLGVSNTLIPSSIQVFITISGTGALTLANPQLTIGSVVPGMKFSASSGTYNQCEPGTYSYDITYKENFGTAFRANPSPAVLNQNILGFPYNTESMYSNQTVYSATSANGAGVATQGTRLWAGFSNVPPNVSISVSGTASNGVGDTAWLVPNAGTDGSGGTPAASGTTAITLSGGAGYATWELVGSNAATVGSLTFTVYVSYGSNPLPGLGTANVAGNYAPVTTIFTSSGPAPEPRFVINPQSATTFTITSCQTNLLFPFVTNQAGFDTGVVLSNTSLDPYGTAPQTGACTLYYYGGTPNGGAAPPSQTSASITGGQQIVFTLSAGNAAQGVVATPGFQGYLIARCNFQYGHGFAFISDLGASKLAEGYLALVLDEDKDTMSGTTRTGTASETNRH